FTVTACNSAYALWLLNRVDYAETIERSLRDEILPRDFRPPLRSSRLSLARICALTGRFDEASEWFAKARVVLESQGARALRAIVDYDEGLMFMRRAAHGDRARARDLMAVASKSFRELNMSGWQKRVDEDEPAIAAMSQ